MFIASLNTGFKLFIVDINFNGTFEQVSTKVCFCYKYDKKFCLKSAFSWLNDCALME